MRCFNCHRELASDSLEVCPSCGVYLTADKKDLLHPGHTLQNGRYILGPILGRSSFGVTYQARHDFLGREVAIKEYFPQEFCKRVKAVQPLQVPDVNAAAYQKGLDLFMRESRLIAQLRHPNVVNVDDYFSENGTAYVVMELLSSKNLRAELKSSRGSLASVRVQQLGEQLISALGAAHALGLYHLDISPEHILMTDSGPKLANFAFSRIQAGHTRGGAQKPAPYAAPEVLINGQAGPWTDIFSLAMVLHELLTGQLPPEAMSRMMGNNWQIAPLGEPWQNLLDHALKLNPTERPRDILKWWEPVHLSAAGGGAASGTAAGAAAEPETEPGRPRRKVIELPSLTNSLGMKFLLIPRGNFQMGSPEEEEERYGGEVLHEVMITKPFYLQTTPVTQGQWQTIMKTTVAQQRDKENKTRSLRGEGDQFPIYYINWDDAQAFIQALNARGEGTYRLPTEAEWEYACRAGSITPFGVGPGFDFDVTMANFDGSYPYGRGEEMDFLDATSPVGSYEPNDWGLYDMHGNLWEWCQDWYDNYAVDVMVDPKGPAKGVRRVARGGSWNNGARSCRSACRNGFSPDSRGNVVGFRLVRMP